MCCSSVSLTCVAYLLQGICFPSAGRVRVSRDDPRISRAGNGAQGSGAGGEASNQRSGGGVGWIRLGGDGRVGVVQEEWRVELVEGVEQAPYGSPSLAGSLPSGAAVLADIATGAEGRGGRAGGGGEEEEERV